MGRWRMVNLEGMNHLVEWMRRQGVRRLRLPDGLELETAAQPAVAAVIADDAPAPVPAPSAFAAPDGDLCACGHSWIDHVESGCLHGCSHEVCLSQATAEPESGVL